jgi:phosphoenolpyruvate carboxylase
MLGQSIRVINMLGQSIRVINMSGQSIRVINMSGQSIRVINFSFFPMDSLPECFAPTDAKTINQKLTTTKHQLIIDAWLSQLINSILHFGFNVSQFFR